MGIIDPLSAAEITTAAFAALAGLSAWIWPRVQAGTVAWRRLFTPAQWAVAVILILTFGGGVGLGYYWWVGGGGSASNVARDTALAAISALGATLALIVLQLDAIHRFADSQTETQAALTKAITALGEIERTELAQLREDVSQVQSLLADRLPTPVEREAEDDG